jgi:hypothetical protein
MKMVKKFEKTTTFYKAEDGRVFYTEQSANEHEKQFNIEQKAKENLNYKEFELNDPCRYYKKIKADKTNLNDLQILFSVKLAVDIERMIDKTGKYFIIEIYDDGLKERTYSCYEMEDFISERTKELNSIREL